MAACALGYRDWTLSPGVSVTVVADEVASMPGSAVLDPQIGKRCRILSRSWEIRIDFGQARAFDVFGFVQPWDQEDETRDYQMIGAADLVRHKLGTTDGASDVYDSTAIASGIVQGYGLHAHFPTATKTGRFYTLSGTGTQPQSFTDIGKIFGMPLIRPSVKPMWGYSDEWRDASEVAVAPRSGMEFVDELYRQRAVSFAFDYLSEAEGRDTFKELTRIAGLRRQVFFARDPASGYLGSEAILGRLERTPAISHPVFQRYATQFVIRQSL